MRRVHYLSIPVPTEYLLMDNERAYWESVTREGVERKPLLIPQKYSIFSWSNIFCEIKMDLLVSQLPKTQDLEPFLIVFSITLKGQNNMMRSQDVEVKRQLLASGDDDSSMKVWDMDWLEKNKHCFANSALSMVVEYKP